LPAPIWTHHSRYLVVLLLALLWHYHLLIWHCVHLLLLHLDIKVCVRARGEESRN